MEYIDGREWGLLLVLGLVPSRSGTLSYSECMGLNCVSLGGSLNPNP